MKNYKKADKLYLIVSILIFYMLISLNSCNSLPDSKIERITEKEAEPDQKCNEIPVNKEKNDYLKVPDRDDDLYRSEKDLPEPDLPLNGPPVPEYTPEYEKPEHCFIYENVIKKPQEALKPKKKESEDTEKEIIQPENTHERIENNSILGKKEEEKLSIKGSGHYSTRSLSVNQDKKFQILFNNGRWIFLGETEEKGGIDFISRAITGDTTKFIFKAEEKAEYTLQFQMQDFIHGNVFNEDVFIKVLDSDVNIDDLKIIDAQGTGDYTLAEELYNRKKYNEALSKYIEQYRRGDPEINNRIAELYFNQEKYKDAVEYWGRNTALKNPVYTNPAVTGIIKTAVLTDNKQLLKECLNSFLLIKDAPIEKIIINTGKYLEKNMAYEDAIRVYRKYLEEYSDEKGKDYYHFVLGSLYEKESMLRDEREAIRQYNIIIEKYPASIFWQQAEERIQYLERHFIHIR